MKNLYEYINSNESVQESEFITEQMIDEGFFTDLIKKASSKAAGKVSDKAKDAWSKISDGAKTAKENIGNYLSDKKDAIKQTFGDAADGVVKTYQSFSKEISNAAGKVKNKLSELSSKAMEATSEILKNTKDGAVQATYLAEAVYFIGKSVNELTALKKHVKAAEELSEKMDDATREKANAFMEEYVSKDIIAALNKFTAE